MALDSTRKNTSKPDTMSNSKKSTVSTPTTPMYMYQQEITQMMFVFGEVAEPAEEVVQLVEGIARTSIQDFILGAVSLANQRRASKYSGTSHSSTASTTLSPEDLIFLIRHDPAKVARMRTFLNWKEVRKNVQSKQDGETDNAADGTEAGLADLVADKRLVHFTWDPFAPFAPYFSPEMEEEEEAVMNADRLDRLRMADEITKNMSREEYLYYSECRQASFTYKKVKRFKEWCQLTEYYEAKATSDVIEILGFLCYEVVAKLTETALAIKQSWETRKTSTFRNSSSLHQSDNLFSLPQQQQTPLEKRHIKAAFQELNRKPVFALNNFGGLSVSPTRLI